MRPRSSHVNRSKSILIERAVGETTRLYDDASTESGAAVLAQTIRTYWSDRGAAVTVQIERIEDVAGRRPVFRVISDLTGGLPRR